MGRACVATTRDSLFRVGRTFFISGGIALKKKIDNLGRVGIPKFIREDMELNKDPCLSIEYDPDEKKITMKKAIQTCSVCGTDEDLLNVGGQFFLCRTCLRKLHQL